MRKRTRSQAFFGDYDVSDDSEEEDGNQSVSFVC
jgi:hypothetical protein